MSAILLVLLIEGIQVVLKSLVLQTVGFAIVALPPKLQFFLYFLILLSPIFIIAIAHHWLNLILDRFFPNVQAPEVGRIESLFPGLISWWEGLYGWQAIALATIVSSFITLSVLSPAYLLSDLLGLWSRTKSFFWFTTLIRLVVIAYLYQFEHLVRTHLIAVGSRRS